MKYVAVACFSFASLLTCGHAIAQGPCDALWIAGPGNPGVSGGVQAITLWDQDGAGPQAAKLIVGGSFLVAGGPSGVLANNIAAYDFASGTWSTLGVGSNNGVTGSVSALSTLPNGDLVVGGFFPFAGGSFVGSVARWNGSTWSAFGSGMNFTVNATTNLLNGDLLTGGAFNTAGGNPANFIARWNGTTWSQFGGGMNGAVLAFQPLPNGELIVGGNFTLAGTVSANRMAIWNGTTWSPLGPGLNNSVNAIVRLSNGDLIVGGTFTATQGNAVLANGVARWNGSTWSALGSGGGGVDGYIYAMLLLPSGDLVVGGDFTHAGGIPANRIASWNLVTSTWSAFGVGLNNAAYSFALQPDGSFLTGGFFITAGGLTANYVAGWGVPTDCGPTCDSIDFNNDTSLFDPQDIEAFLSVYSEGPCVPATATCNDIDFNNDTSLFDPCDINSFLVMYSEGPCTPCGQ